MEPCSLPVVVGEEEADLEEAAMEARLMRFFEVAVSAFLSFLCRLLLAALLLVATSSFDVD